MKKTLGILLVLSIGISISIKHNAAIPLMFLIVLFLAFGLYFIAMYWPVIEDDDL